ncbi:MAG TPA: hypothetical protein VNM22_18875 [Candidatus Limnocylindrales bacterium]|nr:hypothetical protein [Candidatus Limnocylindrales bacterium]
MTEKILHIHYEFNLKNGVQKQFSLNLSGPTLALESEPKPSYPEWTVLTHHQCSNCPLHPEQHPYCPVAVNLSEVIEFFKDFLSFEEAEVRIYTEVREYYTRTPLQEGLSSLIGLIMVTSGCPILNKLRPMAYTHLPFSSLEETKYRAISMYLLAQYFLYREGKKPDWEIKNLVHIYEEIIKVNQDFSRRLASICPKDASLNALASLSCFASITSLSIKDDYLEDIKALFTVYLDEKNLSSEVNPS